jgi:hypothetical protein
MMRTMMLFVPVLMFVQLYECKKDRAQSLLELLACNRVNYEA